MDIGLNFAFGGNPRHDQALLKSLVQTLDALGYASLWMPEHVVAFPTERYQSKYPYSADGAVPWRGDLSLHDPLFVAAAAAQHSERLRFGSGIVILPQRPPLLTAKELMTLDHLSAGRFEFGVGAGWSSEEYAALGVDFARRGARFDDYLRALRAAWGVQPASYEGEFISFEDVVLLPEPFTPGGPKLLIGGSSPAALRRAARLGDGWFGHWPEGANPAAELHALHECLDAADRKAGDFLIKGSLVHGGDPEALRARLDELAALGVKETVLVVPVRTRSMEADLELWAGAAALEAA